MADCEVGSSLTMTSIENQVPEPATIALLGIGLAELAGADVRSSI